jgi:LuxR family maltose regulon positive regulatory protein
MVVITGLDYLGGVGGRPPGGGAQVENAGHVPTLPGTTVGRPRVLTLLFCSRGSSTVLVTAPPGWGKTTVLAQWARADPRPFAWLTIGARHNDPSTLGAELDRLLDGVAPSAAAAGTTGDTRGSPGAASGSVLVLDDVHELIVPAALLRLRRILADRLPPGTQMVLSGRGTPHLHLGRERLGGHVLEVGTTDLAMGAAEASSLLASLDVPATADDVADLLARTEGWAAGLYLAALAHHESRDPGRPVSCLRGTDRAVSEYFHQEVLIECDPATRRFLLSTAVLDRLSGAACDAVLGEHGTGRILETMMASGGRFLVALDREQRQYRYHRLFRELLLRELAATAPAMELELHRRAARWFESQGDLERTVSHARRAGDLDGAGELLLRHVLGLIGTRWQPMVARVLGGFRPHELASSPNLAVVAACHELARGDLRSVERWLSATELATRGRPAGEWIEARELAGALRSWLGLDGPDPATGAGASPSRGARGSPGPSALAQLVEGGARLYAGAPDALECLAVAERCSRSMPLVHIPALALLAVAEVDAGDWAQAGRWGLQARHEAEGSALRDSPLVLLAYAVFALVQVHEGHPDRGCSDIAHCLQHLDALADLVPAAAVLVGLLVAQARLLGGDRAGARVDLSRAAHRLRSLPDAARGGLHQRLAQLQADVDGASTGDADAPALTPAERRVLEFLPTHLTMAEIAARLFVSRNTVKTHTIAIYQKLGASARGQAVERATALGLLAG